MNGHHEMNTYFQQLMLCEAIPQRLSVLVVYRVPIAGMTDLVISVIEYLRKAADKFFLGCLKVDAHVFCGTFLC